MKKLLFLALLTICSISLLQSAADVEGSSNAYVQSLEIKVVTEKEAAESCSSKGESTVIYILRGGQKLIEPVNEDLLNASEPLKNAIADTKNFRDFSLEMSIRYFLGDCSSDKQIVLLINALRYSADKECVLFGEETSHEDVMWLMKQADVWNMPRIKDICAKRLADNIADVPLDEKEHYYNQVILDACSMAPVREAMWHMGCVDAIFHRFNGAEFFTSKKSKALLGKKNQLIIYDSNNGLVEHISIPQMCDDEKICHAEYSSDMSSILLTSSYRVVLYDVKKGTSKDIYTVQRGDDRGDDDSDDEYLYCNKPLCDVRYSRDGSEILITSVIKGVITFIIYDIKKGSLGDEFTTEFLSYDPDYGEGVKDVIYTDDRSKVFMLTTGKDSFIYLLDFDSAQDDGKPPAFKCIWSIADQSIYVTMEYDSNSSQLLIGSSYEVFILDVHKDSTEVIYTGDDDYDFFEEGLNAKYICDRSKVLITSDNRAAVYDTETKESKVIFMYPEGISQSTMYRSDLSEFFVSNSHEVSIYNVKTGSREVLFTSPSKRIELGAYSKNSSQLHIECVYEKEVIIYDLLDDLDIKQKQLLFRALKSWQQGKPHSIANDELDTYARSTKLQHLKLFKLDSDLFFS